MPPAENTLLPFQCARNYLEKRLNLLIKKEKFLKEKCEEISRRIIGFKKQIFLPLEQAEIFSVDTNMFFCGAKNKSSTCSITALTHERMHCSDAYFFKPVGYVAGQNLKLAIISLELGKFSECYN